MHNKFLKWIESIKTDLEAKGITTENINVTPDNAPNPSTTVDHFRKLL